MTFSELIKNMRYRLSGRVVHLVPTKPTKGAVLISYFTYPFLTEKALTGHTNYWEACQMAQEFLSRGYTVDVINTTNASFVPKKHYDICIDTHSNLERLAPLLPPTCIKVLHTTTTHWLAQNTAVYKRHMDLLERRKVALAPERLLPPTRSLEVADIVLLLGNKSVENTYAYAHKKIIPIAISAVRDFPFLESKNFEEARSRFVWLGGAGAVHKGADIVLEAFSQSPELNLTMCGKYLYPEFEAVYDHELNNTPSIKSVGYVDLGSSVFEDIRSKSAFLIFPSCAEGQAGSVVAAMHAGLIPIISKECGVDVEGFGFVLQENTVEEIVRTIRHCASLSPTELATRARAAQEYAQTYHTREKFTQNFSKFVDMLESKHTP